LLLTYLLPCNGLHVTERWKLSAYYYFFICFYFFIFIFIFNTPGSEDPRG